MAEFDIFPGNQRHRRLNYTQKGGGPGKVQDPPTWDLSTPVLKGRSSVPCVGQRRSGSDARASSATTGRSGTSPSAASPMAMSVSGNTPSSSPTRSTCCPPLDADGGVSPM